MTQLEFPKKDLIEGLPGSSWPAGMSVGFVLNIRGPSPLWAAPSPRQETLGCIRKLAKHRLEREPASPFLHGFCFKLLSEFLPSLPP